MRRKRTLPAAVESKMADTRIAMARAEREPKKAAFWLAVAAQSLTEAAALAEKKRGAR